MELSFPCPLLAADGGFNRWTINGAAYPDTMAMVKPMLTLEEARRYRLRLRNQSEDIHPIHQQLHMDYGFMALFEYARPA